MTPAAFGLLRTPGGCHEMRLASVTPYAPLNVVDAEPLAHDAGRPRAAAAPRPAGAALVFASGAPDCGISGRSSSWASRYAIVPSVDVIVAPVRFISGQKFDTENRR